VQIGIGDGTEAEYRSVLAMYGLPFRNVVHDLFSTDLKLGKVEPRSEPVPTRERTSASILESKANT
jgi:hypothetical protein